MLRQDFLHGVSALQAFDLTYDILIFPRHLSVARHVVEQFPDQRFVLDHIAKPLIRDGVIEPWAEEIRHLAAFPNVFCKVSGMVTEADWNSWQIADFFPYLDIVFEAFGPERIMFGSDWPVCLLASDYDTVKGTLESLLGNPGDETYAKIFGGNATDFYRL
jgi:L-fuconolactonase